jgi:hypothetical protein
MDPRRVRTARIGGNQEKIDELEYFLESLGRSLFGAEGEDYRRLGEYLPRNRNLSALVNICKAQGGARDVAEDLRFLHAELEFRNARTAPVVMPGAREGATVFNYRRYSELLASPEKLVARILPNQRLEVVDLVTRGAAYLAPMLSKMNAYAWLGVVGVPDLEREMQGSAVELRLEDEASGSAAGLAKVLATSRFKLGTGLRAYYTVLRDELRDDYRSQFARLAAQTQPLV